jgi:hypothetical protein
MYVFVMNEDFDEKKLVNSSYKLLELGELSDCYRRKNIEYIDKKTKEKKTEIFKATPDLETIITGELKFELEVFEGYLKGELAGQ